MLFDAEIDVLFLTPEEGGRQKNFVDDWYGCPMGVRGKFFDCRLDLRGRTVHLGERILLPVKFLNPDQVLSVIKNGDKVVLWEGRTIARGTIVKVNIQNVEYKMNSYDSPSACPDAKRSIDGTLEGAE